MNPFSSGWYSSPVDLEGISWPIEAVVHAFEEDLGKLDSWPCARGGVSSDGRPKFSLFVSGRKFEVSVRIEVAKILCTVEVLERGGGFLWCWNEWGEGDIIE